MKFICPHDGPYLVSVKEIKIFKHIAVVEVDDTTGKEKELYHPAVVFFGDKLIQIAEPMVDSEWLELREDGVSVFRKSRRSDDVFSYSAEDSITILVDSEGNAYGDVILEFDDEASARLYLEAYVISDKNGGKNNEPF